jgi:hypothetical protein
MPSGFAALRNDNIHAQLGGPDGLPHGVNLVDDLRPGSVGLLDEVCRIA